jgi:hypothetical protein
VYCIHCGTANEDSARHCAHCGRELPPLAPQPEAVPTYLGAAIAVTVLCCLPFGIPAIVYAAQVRPRLESGDRAGALEASRKARRWTWIGFGAGLATVVIYGLLMALASLAGAD